MSILKLWKNITKEKDMTIVFKEMAFNYIEEKGSGHTETVPTYLADKKSELTLLLLGAEDIWKGEAGTILCKVKEEDETYVFDPLNRQWKISDYEQVNLLASV
jgi:hypothetical protein